jgi:hypothetical protein
LYRKLCGTHDRIAFIADEHGGRMFMDGFQKYVEREITCDLFTDRSFQFTNSKAEVMVQVADIISGSWARVWEPARQSPRSSDIAKLLLSRSVGVDIWPPRQMPRPTFLTETERACGPYDEIIRDYCYRRAVQFLQERESDSEGGPSVRDRVLEYLLFQAQFGDDSAFVSTADIISELEATSGVRVSPYELRRTVVAPLRDAGVIVASGPEGYKIPTCADDMRQFAAHARSIIPSMRHRLGNARNELRGVSFDGLDILAGADFTELRLIVEAYELATVRRQ